MGTLIPPSYGDDLPPRNIPLSEKFVCSGPPLSERKITIVLSSKSSSSSLSNTLPTPLSSDLTIAA